jgi:hypothetical protein
VLGVGRGRKRTAGRLTDTEAAVVYVRRKLPAGEVLPALRIPARIEGRPTDVVETGTIRSCSTSPSRRTRPAPGGVSVSHPLSAAGTLGCVVRRGTGTFVLCAGHIAANTNDAAPGDPLLQPAADDGGRPKDVLGRLAEFTPIAFGGPPNDADAAIVRVRPEDVATEIAGIGPLAGTAMPGNGDTVVKQGRTTGLTRGVIEVTAADAWVAFGGGREALFLDMVVARWW